MTFTTTKDPASQEDYTIDYTAPLAESSPGDAIITSAWYTSTVPGNTDLTLDYVNNFLLPDGSNFLLPDGVSLLMLPSTYIIDGKKTTCWVRGGGKLYTTHYLTNRVTTVAGRVWDYTIKVTMQPS